MGFLRQSQPAPAKSKAAFVAFTLLLVQGALLVGAPAALALPDEALKTHNRYASLSAENTVGNTVKFTVTNSWRLNGYTTCYTFSGTTPSSGSCNGPNGNPAIGDIISEGIGGTNFCFGDGSCTGQLYYQATSTDPSRNTFTGRALDPNDPSSLFLTRTYATAGTYTAFIDSCCRISDSSFPNAHMNNPDGSYRFEIIVNAGTGNDSPTSDMPTIKQCPVNATCEFQVPGIDPNGDPLNFRLSTSSEAGSGFDQPTGASISSSGLFSIDTSALALFDTGPEGPKASPTCSDGLDNDSDGLIDGAGTADSDWLDTLSYTGILPPFGYVDLNTNMAYDAGEPYFWDLDYSGDVSVGDVLFNKHGSVLPGSIIGATFVGIGQSLWTPSGSWASWDKDGDGLHTHQDVIVFDGNGNFVADVGEYRGSKSGMKAFASSITASDPEASEPLMGFGVPNLFGFVDANLDGSLGATEAAYLAIGGGSVSDGDSRVRPPTGFDQGSLVVGGDDDCLWNTLYSTQVTIEDLDGQGAVKSKIPVDFFIEVGPVVGTPPWFTLPLIPNCGGEVLIQAGGTLEFIVAATDQDSGDTVTLNAASLPPGSTMTDPLPQSGNPVSSFFSWDVPANQFDDEVISFVATDQAGQEATCSITADVDLPIGTGLQNAGFEGTGAASHALPCDTTFWEPGTVVDAVDASGAVDIGPGALTVTPPEGSCMAQLGSTYNTDADTQPEGVNEMWQDFILTTSLLEFQWNMVTFDYTGFDVATWELVLLGSGAVIASGVQTAWGTPGDTSLKTTGWQGQTVNTAPYLGQVARLYFSLEGTSDDLFPSMLFVDTLGIGGVPQNPVQPTGSVPSGVTVPNWNGQTYGPYTYNTDPNGLIDIALSVKGQTAAPTNLQYGALVTCPGGAAPTASGDPYAGTGSSGVDLMLNGVLYANSMGIVQPAVAPTWYSTVNLPGGVSPGGIPANEVVGGVLSLRVDCAGVIYIMNVGTVTLYDPSGVVADGTTCTDPADVTTCDPVANAEVRLFSVPGWVADDGGDLELGECESNDSVGHVAASWNQPAPVGLGEEVNPLSGTIDPSANPLFTDANGDYGWDVAAGCYFLVVTHPDYVPYVSPVVGVPPAVTDLHVLLTPVSAALAAADAVGQLDMGNKAVDYYRVTILDAAGATVVGACDVFVTDKSIGCVNGATALAFPYFLIGAGTYDIVVSSPGFNDLTLDNQALAAGKVKKLALKPTTAGALLLLDVKTASVGAFELVVTDPNDGDATVDTCQADMVARTVGCDTGTSPKFPYVLWEAFPGTVDLAADAGASFDPFTKAGVKLAAGKVTTQSMKFTPLLGLIELKMKQANVDSFAFGLSDGSVCPVDMVLKTLDCVGGDAVALAFPFVGMPAGTYDVNAEADGGFDPWEKDGFKVAAGKVGAATITFKQDSDGGEGLIELKTKATNIAVFGVDVSEAASDDPVGSCIVDMVAKTTLCDSGSPLSSPAHLFIQLPAGTYDVSADAVLGGSGSYTTSNLAVAAGKTKTVNVKFDAPAGTATVQLETKSPFIATYELLLVDALGATIDTCQVDVPMKMVTCGALVSPGWAYVEVPLAGLPAGGVMATANAGPHFTDVMKTLALTAGKTTKFTVDFKFA